MIFCVRIAELIGVVPISAINRRPNCAAPLRTGISFVPYFSPWGQPNLSAVFNLWIAAMMSFSKVAILQQLAGHLMTCPQKTWVPAPTVNIHLMRKQESQNSCLAFTHSVFSAWKYVIIFLFSSFVSSEFLIFIFISGFVLIYSGGHLSSLSQNPHLQSRCGQAGIKHSCSTFG